MRLSDCNDPNEDREPVGYEYIGPEDGDDDDYNSIENWRPIYETSEPTDEEIQEFIQKVKESGTYLH